MPQADTKYDEKQARITERAYRTPEIAAQRMATLRALALRSGERVLDVGTGPGLLASDMAQIVGGAGGVVGIDNADAMVAIARRRCAELPQVEISRGDAQELTQPGACFDAVVCTQVLLYVPQVQTALEEMHRVLKPGGRIVVIETDWRGLVLHSSFAELTEQMTQSWDSAVASPQLPSMLDQKLRQAGFRSVSVEAVPVLLTSFLPDNYACTMAHSLADYAVKQKLVKDADAKDWLADLQQKHDDGTFFFCINRFLFKACKV